jgi:glutaredoxin 3
MTQGLVIKNSDKAIWNHATMILVGLHLEDHMEKAEVVIYTKPGCPFCARAKALLESKAVVYQEFNVGDDPVKRADLVKISNGSKTVPQIFIDGHHVGGCDDLHALDRQGKLDQMLKLRP